LAKIAVGRQAQSSSAGLSLPRTSEVINMPRSGLGTTMAFLGAASVDELVGRPYQ
jgi:isopentenyl diphosphate isomerase/L-lactate dehydrogenase-like FMN-dependent dehydrogenase